MIVSTLLDLLYPRVCELCGKRILEPGIDALCISCDETVEWVGGRTCRCGAMLVWEPGDADDRCLECEGKEIAFKEAVAAGRYVGNLRELVHRFKFHRHRHLAGLFAARVVRQLREKGWARSIDLGVPVPTVLGRILERGYNAAEAFAERLASQMERPWRRALSVQRRTRSQTDLSGRQRLKNPIGAFAVRARVVRERTVLLVDDVLTTGATANECTRVLREAGARQVYVAVIGR